MPRYFMHLVDSSGTTLDPEGIELPPDAIVGVALTQARDCMAGDVQSGRLDFSYRIDVHDESGALVHSLTFRDALDIVGEA